MALWLAAKSRPSGDAAQEEGLERGRIPTDRVLEAADGAPRRGRRRFDEVVPARQARLAHLGLRRAGPAARRPELHSQRLRHLGGDSILQREQIGQLLVGFVRPEALSVAQAQELERTA